jgi:hypothetical protein
MQKLLSKFFVQYFIYGSVKDDGIQLFLHHVQFLFLF